MREKTKIDLEFHSKFKNYPTVKEKMIRAADMLEEEANINGSFDEFILEHEFQGHKGFADCGDSNERVLARLLSGAERLTPEVDHTWNIKVIPYSSRKRVIGYTYPNREEIWVNMKYYNTKTWSEADCAGNLSHEWTHKAGFGHSYRRSWMWPATVPYAVGSYFKKVISIRLGKLNLDEVESGGLNHMSWYRRAFYKVINLIF